MVRVAGLVVAVACFTALAPCAAQDISEPAKDEYRRGYGLNQTGNLADAEAHLVHAVRLAPKYTDAWWTLAWTRYGMHRTEAALDNFRQALALMSPEDPRRGDAQRWIAKLQAELARPRRRVTTRYVPPPEDPFIAFLLGWPLALFGLLVIVCLAATLGALRADARSGPGSPAARFAEACRRAATGDPRAAKLLLALVDEPALAGFPLTDFSRPLRVGAGSSAELRGALALALRTGDGRTQRVAAEALAGLPDQPDPAAWTPLLTARGEDLRRAALRSLSQVPEPGAVPALCELARGAGPGAAQAVQGLARQGDAAALTALVEVCATGRDAAARLLAAEALAAREALPGELAPRLAELLATAEALGRPLLVRALAACGQRALPSLREALLDPEPGVRETARDVLLGPVRFETGEAAAAPLRQALLAAPGRATREALDVLAAWAPGTLLPLYAAVLAHQPGEHEDWSARLTALAQLGRSDAEEAAELLTRALAACPPTPHPLGARAEYLTALCEAVAERGLVACLPALLERAAVGPELPAPWRAARTLSARPDAGPALADAVGSDAGKVRRLALHLLARHPHEAAAEALLAALTPHEDDWEPVRDAAEALGKLRTPGSREALARLLETHPDARDDRVDVALAQLGDPVAVSRVEAMLVRPTWAERRPAADYFRGLPDVPPRAAAVVREADAHDTARALLDEPRPDAAALAALGEPVQPSLEAWLLAGHHRRLVADALARLGHRKAPRLAELLDRADALLADGSPAAQTELTALAQRSVPTLRDYITARLNTPTEPRA